MFMSCVGILVLCGVKILAAPPITPNKVPGPSSSTDPPDSNEFPPSPSSSTEACEGNGCRPSPNLVGPIVGGLCAILVVVLIGIFIIWFYLRRKTQPKKEITPEKPAIKFIEYPPLYTGAISTTDSASRLYGMSPSRNDSIASHLYEKIQYSEQTKKPT